MEDAKGRCHEGCGEGYTERACDDDKQQLRGERECRRQANDLALNHWCDDVALEEMDEDEKQDSQQTLSGADCDR